jgi:hypothetical protein
LVIELSVKINFNLLLQGELDTLAATLKQLETQKGEAQKRLNDLKNQVSKLIICIGSFQVIA